MGLKKAIQGPLRGGGQLPCGGRILLPALLLCSVAVALAVLVLGPTYMTTSVRVTLTGTVVDGDTGAPLPGVRVLANSSVPQLQDRDWRGRMLDPSLHSADGKPMMRSGCDETDNQGRFTVRYVVLFRRRASVLERWLGGGGDVPDRYGVGGLFLRLPGYEERLVSSPDGTWSWEPASEADASTRPVPHAGALDLGSLSLSKAR